MGVSKSNPCALCLSDGQESLRIGAVLIEQRLVRAIHLTFSFDMIRFCTLVHFQLRLCRLPVFDGGPPRAYNEFYAAVKTAGRYEIVGSPADAELILEIGLAVTEVSGGGGGKGAYWYDPQLRLAIRDPKTNVLLWAFTKHVQWALLRENRQKNFDQTMAKIISDLQGLNTPSSNAPTP